MYGCVLLTAWCIGKTLFKYTKVLLVYQAVFVSTELGWSWCNLASDIKFLFTTFDVYHLRFRLFPEPLLRSLKSGNSPSAQTARIFTFTPQMLFFGNNLRLDGTHLRLDELFAVGRYLAPLPFQSGVVLVTLRFFVHLRPFL